MDCFLHDPRKVIRVFSSPFLLRNNVHRYFSRDFSIFSRLVSSTDSAEFTLMNRDTEKENREKKEKKHERKKNCS